MNNTSVKATIVLGISLLLAAPITAFGLGAILWLLDGNHGFTTFFETWWICESVAGVLLIVLGFRRLQAK
jgi:hypothetical protein